MAGRISSAITWMECCGCCSCSFFVVVASSASILLTLEIATISYRRYQCQCPKALLQLRQDLSLFFTLKATRVPFGSWWELACSSCRSPISTEKGSNKKLLESCGINRLLQHIMPSYELAFIALCIVTIIGVLTRKYIPQRYQPTIQHLATIYLTIFFITLLFKAVHHLAQYYDKSFALWLNTFGRLIITIYLFLDDGNNKEIGCI